MDDAFELQLDPSISSRFDLLGQLTELAQAIQNNLAAGRLVITAKLLQAMNREFIALQVATTSREMDLEVTKHDLGNLWRLQKRIARAWQSAHVRQSA